MPFLKLKELSIIFSLFFWVKCLVLSNAFSVLHDHVSPPPPILLILMILYWTILEFLRSPTWSQCLVELGNKNEVDALQESMAMGGK